MLNVYAASLSMKSCHAYPGRRGEDAVNDMSSSEVLRMPDRVSYSWPGEGTSRYEAGTIGPHYEFELRDGLDHRDWSCSQRCIALMARAVLQYEEAMSG